MRQIKFRAWDGKIKKFKEGLPLLDLVFGKGYGSNYININVQLPPGPHRFWMHPIFSQYTGLEDKNGTEIYEGDIVTIQTNQTKTVFREVYFSNGAYRLSDSHIILTELEVSDFNLTVVGNIYENPELLKGDVTARIAASINARVNQGREANERW